MEGMLISMNIGDKVRQWEVIDTSIKSHFGFAVLKSVNR
jgi:hypothetical protein